MTPDMQAAFDSMKSMAHYWEWMRYADVRHGIPSAHIPMSKNGKHRIECALAQLERDGRVKWKRRGKSEVWSLKDADAKA